MKYFLSLYIILFTLAAKSQVPDHIYKANIHSVKLFKAGDPYSYPLMRLNGTDELEL